MSADRTVDKRTVVGLIAGIAALGGYLWLVGIDAVVGSLRQVPSRRAASLLVVGFVPIVLWRTGLRFVLDVVESSLTLPRAILLFDATGFINSVTPFGQAGGDPVSGLLAARVVPMRYERSLAAIVSLNTINRLASVLLGLVGAGSLLIRVGFTDSVRSAALVGSAAVVAAGAGGTIIWLRRDSGIEPTTRLVAASLTRLSWVPRFEPPSREAIRRRLRGFVTAIERLGASRRRLALIGCLALGGQLAVGATLWIGLRSLGAEPSLALVLLIVPVAKLSGVAPTPGGLGTATAVLTGLLVTLTAIDVVTAAAAALLYRTAAFWVPTLSGGLALLFLLAVPARSGASTAPASDANRSDTRLAFALAGGLATLFLVGVHLRNTLIEPTSPFVHVVRDGGVAFLRFAVLWLGFQFFERRRSDHDGHQ